MDEVEKGSQYCEDVLSGKILACEKVIQACQRHVDDLENGHERGLKFSYSRAMRVFDFIRYCKHSKGKWAGKTLELEPWQCFVTMVIFGWENSEGKRRFRTAYIEVARKNGKSTWMAAIGNYLFIGDGEAGAEVYNFATKMKQARIIHQESIRMVKKSKILKKYVDIKKDNLNCEKNGSKYEPLGQDGDTEDGLNVHGGIADELHAQKSHEMWDVIETGMGSRDQPIMLAITTAGFNHDGICMEQRNLASQILEGVIIDDTFFAIIFTLDEGDDWKDETVWIKANPNLDISVYKADMVRLKNQAINSPRKQVNFKTKKLNIWCQSEETWLNMEFYKECESEFSDEILKNRQCLLGLDLSAKVDFTGAAYVFPPSAEDKFWRMVVDIYFPEDNIEMKSDKSKIPLQLWVDQGHVKTTLGNTVDYDYIVDDILENKQVYKLHEIDFDPWNATQTAITLENKGFTTVEIRQGGKSLSEPCKELEAMICDRSMKIRVNPCLRWMAANVVTEADRNGNLLPSKKKSTGNIDGIAAILTALARALVIHDEQSVYTTRGIRTF